MATLSEYQTDTRAILNDPNAQFYSTANLTRWINRARKQVAEMTQCVRAIPRPYASVTSLTVTNGGSGYTSPPTITISTPDAFGLGFVTATATAVLTGDTVTSITLTNAGTGYLSATATFSGGDGSGAAATVNLQSFLATVVGQEVYNFSTANAILQSQYPGIARIIGVQTVAVSWGSWKPVMAVQPWSGFQAYCRSFNIVTQNYPFIIGQYGQGANGSIYMYPIPATQAQMEWDCYCHPIDLTGAVDEVDLIPEPWTEAVWYYAASLAYKNAQRSDDSQMMLGEFRRIIIGGRVASTPSIVPTFYGTGD